LLHSKNTFLPWIFRWHGVKKRTNYNDDCDYLSVPVFLPH